MVRPEKKKIVEAIKDKLGKAKEVILTDYRGLSVKEISELRKKLRDGGIEYKVYKNTLAKIALTGEQCEDLKVFLEGPTAFAFDYENDIEAARKLREFAKEHKKLEIKGGVIEGRVVDAQMVKQYASLLSREELIAKVLGTMKAPIQQVTSAITAPLQGLINVIKAKAKQAD